MNCEQVRHLIDAYVDDELDSATAKAIAMHLPQCLDCAAAVDGRVLLGSKLHLLHQTPAPPRLRQSILTRLDREDQADADRLVAHLSRRSAFKMTAAAAVFGLAVGTGIGIGVGSGLIRGRQDADRGDDLAARHAARLAHPQAMVKIRSDDRHAIKPWFAGKVDFAPPVRELASRGFVLVGGDLDTIEHQTAAVIVYRIRNHDISLYTWRPRGQSDLAPTASVSRGFNLVSWIAGGVRCVAVSDVEVADLLRFGQAMAESVSN